MTIVPKMFYERDLNVIHCTGNSGNDYTLCGASLDGYPTTMTETQGCRINCPACLSVIRLVRSLSARALPKHFNQQTEIR